MSLRHREEGPHTWSGIYNSVEQSIKHESRSGESGRGETVEVGGALPALLATGHDHTAAAASE